MSMWSNYVKERENVEILETPEGFASYRITNKECYITDIWVSPEHRKSKVASKMADKIAEIAKAAGCTYLLGSVSPLANNSHTSLLVLLGYGFKLHSSSHNIIFFTKELS